MICLGDIRGKRKPSRLTPVSPTLSVRLTEHELYDSPPPRDSGREKLEMKRSVTVIL